MSPLTVVCFCTYRTRKTSNWTDRDFAAYKLMKAIKGQPVSGWADIPVEPGAWARLDGSHASAAYNIFGRMAAQLVEWAAVRPSAVVPIPNSSSTVARAESPKTRALADALVKHAQATADVVVADVLRWSEPMGAAHACMSRRYPEQLYPFLRLIRTLPVDRAVILVDDMLTTGGHMRAVAAFLAGHGATVWGGVCAGRSDDSLTIGDAFAARVDVLEPFVFDPSLLQDWGDDRA